MQGPDAGALSEYRIFETEEFLRKLAKRSTHDRDAIRAKLTDYAYARLREQPHHGANIRKLRGYTPDTWRYRVGRFRVFYIVASEEQTVYLLTVEARKDAYRQMHFLVDAVIDLPGEDRYG